MVILLLLLAILTPNVSYSQNCTIFFSGVNSYMTDDQFLIYEEVENPEVLKWVEGKNQATFDVLKSDPRFQEIRDYMLSLLNSQDRIIYGAFYKNSDIVRNFWKDSQNPQGILRQTTQQKYFSGNYQWETILDIDALSKQENKTWVYGGGAMPINNTSLGLIGLSNGGKDAKEFREFDYVKKQFIQNGFFLPESKSRVSYLDNDTLIVGDAFTDENMTDSGYPRVVKIWKRGTPYSEAKTIFEADKSDLSVSGSLAEVKENDYQLFITKALNFYEYQNFVYLNNELVEIKIPKDAELTEFFNGIAFVTLKSDWEHEGQVFKQGSIVKFDFYEFLKTNKSVSLFLPPSEFGSYEAVASTKNYLYVLELLHVQSKLTQYKFENGELVGKAVPLPENGSISFSSSPENENFIIVQFESFLTPSSLIKIDEHTFEMTTLQSLPARFDSSQYQVQQHFATSKDGTQVPFHVFSKKDLKYDGKNPTLQYGYGGFEVSMLPHYQGSLAKTWLDYGGVYVQTNIRGGGEYGPKWHRAALTHNRHKAYEDFEAISLKLFELGITSPSYLGIEGGSNGGLLTGTMVTRNPELYSAAIIAVPLLDMMRFHKLLAGASWMAEYGNPENPKDREYLMSYSPFQNLKPNTKYPEVFVFTSTKDDRVHPAHARKFVRRMEDQGHPHFYYENTEGGHGGSANNIQSAENVAMERVYLLQKLLDANKMGK